MMQFSVLGPIAVHADEPVVIGSRHQRAVLAMLLAHAGRSVTVDELVDGLWGEEPPATAVKTLRSYVSRVRQHVGDVIASAETGYRIELGRGQLDAERFERLVCDADDAGAAEAVGLFDEALALWRGPPFGEFCDLPTVRSEARRLDLLRQSAQLDRVQALLDAGNLPRAVSGAEAVVTDMPVAEQAWAVLIRGLARSGRVGDALRAFQRASAALGDAGLEPGADLKAAEAEALDQSDVDRPRPSASPLAPSPLASSPLASSMPADLPTPLTAIVGRTGHVERLVELSGDRRVVTLVGPGGVGKTRLALEVARRVRDAGRRAVVVELARVIEPPDVVAAVSRALDVSRPRDGGVPGMGDLDAVLVLDNCEHVIDAAAALVPELLRGGDRLRVLATSRERLGVSGEHVWPVAPLSVVGRESPALALFFERASDVGAELDLDDDRISDVVARLDGLPLAIEMAAARLATMGIADLSDELDRSLGSLGTGMRTSEDRHATLGSLLEWSEALLVDEGQRTLHEFATFAGSVRRHDLPAAVSASDPTRVVRDLAERSLITVETRDGRARYRMLDTVRQFGRIRQAEMGIADTCSARHAAWFAEAAHQIHLQRQTDAERDAVQRFESIHDELRVAHRWARANDRALATRMLEWLYESAILGGHVEIFDWASDLGGQLADDDDNGPTVWGIEAAGRSYAGRLDEATELAERAMRFAASPFDARYALEALSDVSLYEGRLHDAERHARAMLEGSRPVPGTLHHSVAMAGLTLALGYRGETTAALELLDGIPPGRSPSAAGWIAYCRGELLLDSSPEQALSELDRAIGLAASVRARFLEGVAQVSAASLAARTGQPGDAAVRFASVIDRFLERRNRTHLLTTLRNLVPLLVRLDRHAEAAQLLGAVEDEDLNPTYGDERARLEAAAGEARQALGDDGFSLEVSRGRARDLEEAARQAAAWLAAASLSSGSPTWP